MLIIILYFLYYTNNNLILIKKTIELSYNNHNNTYLLIQDEYNKYIINKFSPDKYKHLKNINFLIESLNYNKNNININLYKNIDGSVKTFNMSTYTNI